MTKENTMPTFGQFQNGTHRVSYRVYYEDTDAGGVVYHANFLKFAERARTDALRAMEIGQQRLREEVGILFVVRRIETDYLFPGRLDDLLTVETTLRELGRASMSMRQRILRDRKILAELKVGIVTVRPNFKATAIPDQVREAMKKKFSLP